MGVGPGGAVVVVVVGGAVVVVVVVGGAVVVVVVGGAVVVVVEGAVVDVGGRRFAHAGAASTVSASANTANDNRK